MKLKRLLTVSSLSLVAAAGLIFSVSANRGAKEAKATDAPVYFNVAGFEPTYEDGGTKQTEFSVYAFKDGGNEWLDVNKMAGHPNVLTVSADTSYTGFIVVRAKEGVKNTWPDQSVDSWNQTSNLTRTSSATNYYHIGGTGENFGKNNFSVDIEETKFSIYGEEDLSMSFNYDSGEFYITELSLNDEQQCIIKKGTAEYGYDQIDEGCDSLFGDCEQAKHFRVLSDGTYAFYLRPSGEKPIWAQVDPTVEAQDWAEGFVEDLACSDDYDTAPNNWDFYSGTFSSLSDGAKDILIAAEARNDDNATPIQKAVFMHDMCVAKYGNLCPLFMQREGGGSRAIYIPQPFNGVNMNNTALIIIIASAITVASLLGLAIFKKNKSK